MFDSLYTIEFWFIAILLVGAIWIKVRYVHSDAFRQGASKGFALGMNRTIKIMLESNMINSKDDSGNDLTEEELIQKLRPKIVDRLLKEVSGKE